MSGEQTNINMRPDYQRMGSYMDEFDIAAQIREATDSPSPLRRLLDDPTILESIPNSKHRKDPRRPSRSPQREHRSSMVLALALAEEERQNKHLKSLLSTTGERMEYETRRADQAEAQAAHTDRRIAEVSTKINSSENARRELENAIARKDLEMRRCQLRLEMVERELKRAQDDVEGLRVQSQDFEDSLEKAKVTSRKLKTTLREYEAQEQGRQETRKLRMDICFKNGQNEGWNTGYQEGYEQGRHEGLKEGRKAGRREGVLEGMEQGRMEERKSALEAFDNFLAAEDINGSGGGRTRRWAQSIYYPDAPEVDFSSRSTSPVAKAKP